jgi:hypothetical protein
MSEFDPVAAAAQLRQAIIDDAPRLHADNERLQSLLETANAYGAAENAARIADRGRLAQMMIRQWLSTGHGDTVADLVRELEPQIERLRAENAALRHVINMAARTLAGEGIEDQGEAYDKCARILDAALGGEKKDE